MEKKDSWIGRFEEIFNGLQPDGCLPTELMVGSQCGLYPYPGVREMMEVVAAEAATVATSTKHCLSVIESCQSPIEVAMAVSLMLAAERAVTDMRKPADDEDKKSWLEAGSLVVEPQAKIGRYRVDFLLTHATGPYPSQTIKSVVIECDGHAYHETREAAARDKRRDRFLQRHYPVLRFTGSEIWKDPLMCGTEALRFLGLLGEDE